MQTENF